MYPRLVSNSWSSCLSFPIARITGLCQHTGKLTFNQYKAGGSWRSRPAWAIYRDLSQNKQKPHKIVHINGITWCFNSITVDIVYYLSQVKYIYFLKHLLLFCFIETGSLHSSGWPQTLNPSVVASWVLGLQGIPLSPGVYPCFVVKSSTVLQKTANQTPTM
jgi:hypothetical protein